MEEEKVEKRLETKMEGKCDVDGGLSKLDQAGAFLFWEAAFGFRHEGPESWVLGR